MISYIKYWVMTSSKTFLIFSTVFICVLIFPLSILNILTGVVYPGSCDNVDILGLNVAQHLLILGLICLIYSTLFVVTNILIMLENDIGKFRSLVFIWITCTILSFFWITLGIIILIKSKTKCIEDISTYIYIYVAIFWALTILSLVRDCCCEDK